MKGFKVFTDDLRPPVQGGDPVWNGETPFELPSVKLDKSSSSCAAGWNFVKEVKTGLLIAGLWPNGRPSRVFSVEATGKIIERYDKIRTDKLTVLDELGDEEIKAVEAVNAGATGYMIKPLNPHEICSIAEKNT